MYGGLRRRRLLANCKADTLEPFERLSKDDYMITSIGVSNLENDIAAADQKCDLLATR